VPKYQLKAVNPLKGYKSEINGVKISEIVNIEIFSLSFKKMQENKVASILKKILKCKLPPPGQSVNIASKNVRILRLATDQMFVLFNRRELHSMNKNFQHLSEFFYLTEQTDAWSGLRLSGLPTYACLERICPINLSPKHFLVHSFARTTMEHLNIIITKTKSNEFELYSGSSFAQSFLHTIETSAKNI